MRRRAALCLMMSGLAAGCAVHEEPEPKPEVAVRLAIAELRDVELSVRAPALVHPRQQANIAPRITAGIRELLVRKGDRVVAGALLARLEDSDVLAQRAEAEASLHQAQVLAERRAKLFEAGAIPQRELLLTETELAQAKARLQLSDAQRSFAELRSPFAGTLTEQFLYPGDIARPDSPLFTLMDIATAVARGQVPEIDAAAIRAGQACRFAPTDRSETEFAGRITVVTRTVDPGRRTVEAWCEIPNHAGRLLPGAFGDLSVVVGQAPQSVVVPVVAVEFNEGTRKGSVVVVDAQNVAHRKDVVGGELFDGKLQVKQGLAAGERVVVVGGYGLPDGTAVRIEDKESR